MTGKFHHPAPPRQLLCVGNLHSLPCRLPALLFSASIFIKAIWQQNGNNVACRIELSTLLVYPVLFLFVWGFVAVQRLHEGPSHRSAARSAVAVVSALMADVDTGEMRRTRPAEPFTLACDPVSRWGYSRLSLCLSSWRNLWEKVVAMATRRSPEQKPMLFPWWTQLNFLVHSQGQSCFSLCREWWGCAGFLKNIFFP